MTDRLLSREEAAAFLQVPPRTLAAWAHQRRGPRFYKVGRFARYRMADLVSWLDGQAVNGNRK